MSESETRLQVAVGAGAAAVKIPCRALFSCANDFRSLLYCLWPARAQHFVFDLTECKMMDSTFLGILAKFARTVREAGESAGSLALVNPGERALSQLENLGVKHLFPVLEGHSLSGVGPFQEVIRAAPLSKLELARMALDSHLELIGINPKNLGTFRNVIEVLQEEIQSLGDEQPSGPAPAEPPTGGDSKAGPGNLPPRA